MLLEEESQSSKSVFGDEVLPFFLSSLKNPFIISITWGTESTILSYVLFWSTGSNLTASFLRTKNATGFTVIPAPDPPPKGCLAVSYTHSDAADE